MRVFDGGWDGEGDEEGVGAEGQVWMSGRKVVFVEIRC